MAFPLNPSYGDTYTEGNDVYTYYGPNTGWLRTTVNSGNSTTYRSANYIPSGATPGQILTAGSDGLLSWANPGAGGTIDSVNGYTGVVNLNATDIGLGNVNNTADADKPVSTAQLSAINEAVTNARRVSNLLVNTDPTVYADGAAATADPGSTGAWYYTNGSGTDKINWYFFGQSPNAADTTNLSEVSNLWASVITRTATTLLPFVAVYTKPQGDGNDAAVWYRSRLVFQLAPSDPNWPGGGIPNNTNILLYTGEDPVSVLPTLAHYRLNLVDFTTVGPQGPTEEILTVSLSTDSSAAAGDYAFAVRSVGYENLNDGAVQYNLLTVSGNAPDATFAVKPVVTPVDLPTVDQGALATATQTADSQWPGLAWYFYDYTGTPGSYNRASDTGTVGIIENTPGTYTMKCRAAWPFGISDEATINFIVNAFSLNQDTMFGGVDGLTASLFLSGWDTNYIAIPGAVVHDQGSAYVWDNGSLVPDTANCIAFWSYTSDKVLAFRYNSSGTLEEPHYWSNIATLPAQGDDFGSGGVNWTSTSTQQDAANNSSVLGKRVPLGGSYDGGFGSTHFLELTVADSSFNNFGQNNTNWSYGFRLKDDWICQAFGQQLLSPTGSTYFVNTITGYGVGSTPYEYVVFGDDLSGPFVNDINGVSWDASATNWLIGSAGDLVVVTYDGPVTGTWKVYVEGTLIYSSTNVSFFMDSLVPTNTLRFGDSGGSSQPGRPTASGALTGWTARLDSIFVANGAAFDQAQVTELTADKADLTLSDNYASITHLGTFDGSGTTSVKGGLSFSRGDISYA